MNFLGILVLVCVSLLSVACAGRHKPEVAPAPQRLGPPVVREGIVYTPASVGAKGCVLYSIQIPSGNAPAAMAYQSTDGQFSYGRPERCVRRQGPRPVSQ